MIILTTRFGEINVLLAINRKIKRKLFLEVLKESRKDAKKLWHHLRDIAPKCYVNQPSLLHVDSIIILDPKEIANSFSDYFSSIVETLIPSPSSSSNSNPNSNLLRKHISNKLDSNYHHSIPLITNEDVLKQHSSLPMNVATGLDGASTKLLRLSAPIISQGITNIINLI